ncbi:MAG: PIN domain-containing protein [Chloroflexi bacterium]|nr:PIN domain-containing protein [Chloroflexota bacterium]
MSNATPANEFVADTVALVLRLEERKMGANAESVFERVESSQATIYIPAMVLAEILYLSEKRRIVTSLDTVRDYMRRYPNCQEQPMNFAVMRSASEITDIPELHDRLIAATARSFDLELITDDSVIQASAYVKTIW